MKTNDISHEGTIISIEKENLRVRIIQNSACASCKIAGHCQTAESKEKIIEVTTPDYADFSVGDKVNVTESVGVGAKARLRIYTASCLDDGSHYFSHYCFRRIGRSGGFGRNSKSPTLLFGSLFPAWIYEEYYGIRN